MSHKPYNPIRIISFGGGVQSTALAILLGQGQIQADMVIFANVGANSENPATLDYIEQYTKPYLSQIGIPFVEVNNSGKDLYDFTMQAEKSIPLPIHIRGAGMGNRTCTTEFKIKPIDRYLKAQGYTHAIITLGISFDEAHRIKTETWEKVGRLYKRYEHPLVNMRLKRGDCKRIIESAGMPVPDKSACYFCPFQRRSSWIALKTDTPDLFDKAVLLDDTVNERFNRLGRGECSLHSSGKPLSQMVESQPMLGSEFEECGGHCHT